MKYSKMMTLMFVSMFYFSCASAAMIGTSPEWYRNPPQNNNDYVYFTFSESDMNLDIAHNKVGEAFYKEITGRFGISSFESLRSDVKDLKAEIIGSIIELDNPNINVIENESIEENSRFFVFVVAKVNRNYLLDLENKFLEILRSGSSVYQYTKIANESVKEKNFYVGVVNYLKAAQESLYSISKSVSERNLILAIEYLKKITMEKDKSPASISVGGNGLFLSSMALKENGSSPKWGNVSVKVIFKDKKKGSAVGERFALMRTDENGQIEFVHPSPGYVGSGLVEVSLDLLRDFEELEKFRSTFPLLTKELEELVNNIRVLFNFEIVSSAPVVRTGVYIIDSDFLKKPLENEYTSDSLTTSLLEAGFNISTLNLKRDSFLDLSEAELLRDLPYMVDPGIKRIIFGIASIIDYNETDVGFTVVTEANLKVLDLETGDLLFNEILNKRVQGGESQSTISASFKELGKSFSIELIKKLP